MIQDRQGTIWVANRAGLFRFANGKWTTLDKAHGYSGAEAFSLYEDRAGRLWVGTASGVYRRNGESLELVDAEATNVQSLTEDANGAIWVTDARDIVRKLSTQVAPQHAREIRLPAGAWRLLRDSRNQIWIAAFGGGLLRVRDPLAAAPLVERYEYEHRLAGSPRSLFEDREGNVWVGMRGGLIRLSERSFSSVGQLEGLTNEGVRTAAVGGDGSVWVATGHALNRFSGSTRTSLNVAQTMALHSDRRGTLWVAGAQKISRLVGNTAGRRQRPRRDSDEPRHGHHHRRAGHVVALHGVARGDDVGRQGGLAIRGASGPCEQGLPVHLHRQPGTRVDGASDGWCGRARVREVPFLRLSAKDCREGRCWRSPRIGAGESG